MYTLSIKTHGQEFIISAYTEEDKNHLLNAMRTMDPDCVIEFLEFV